MRDSRNLSSVKLKVTNSLALDRGGLRPPFTRKEKRMEFFLSDLLEDSSRKSRVNFYNAFDQHIEIESEVSADVLLTCVDYCLVRRKYKLTTSEKKWLVKALEKCNAESFRLALTESRKIANRAIKVLEFLDYNKFSRSIEHRVIVKDLRNGSLTTVKQIIKQKLSGEGGAGIAQVLDKLPSLFWSNLELLEKSLSDEELLRIGKELCNRFSTADLVSILTKEENRVLHEILKEHLAKLNLEIRGKRTKFNWENYSPEFSYWNEVVANTISDDTRWIRVKLQWKDTVVNSIDLITTKEDGHLTILGHGEEREELLSSKDNCGVRCAEWVDLDLAKVSGKFNFNAHLYSGRNSFRQVNECILKVEKLTELGGESIESLIEWRLMNDSGFVDLGTLSTSDRIFAWRGKSTKYNVSKILTKQRELNYSLKDLINDVVEQQNLTVVKNGEDFTIVL